MLLSYLVVFGSPRKALERIGIDVNVVDYVEIDKYAVKSYNAMYGENFETQDIKTWDKQLEVDLIFHGSPCQDFSLAGNQAGGDEGSGTRSSLLYETVRIVKNLKPKYVIWENVKNVISQKHRHNFDNYLNEMEQLGYTNYYKVLNAKSYGIPQNRERVFTVSILGEHIPFSFPVKLELELRLKDMLESNVDEKYYLSDSMTKYVLDINDKQKGTKWEGRADGDILNPNIAHTLSVRGAGGGQRAGVSNFIVDNIYGEIKVKELKLLIKNATKQGYIEAVEGDSVNLVYPNSKTRRGRVGKQISQTLTTSDNMGVIEKISSIDLKIRKLTPLECFRLMGFNDSDFEKAQQVNSNAQLYKQAGNSIVVNVLEEIFKKLL